MSSFSRYLTHNGPVRGHCGFAYNVVELVQVDSTLLWVDCSADGTLTSAVLYRLK